MPDFRALVREHVRPLHLPSDRELTVVEEYAQYIEDVHAALLEEGLSADAAWLEVQRRIPPWLEWQQQLLEAGAPWRVLIQDRHPRPPMSIRQALVATGRQTWNARHDVRQSLRRLGTSRAFAAIAITTLAICLGTNAAVFTIVYRALLHPLSVTDPSRIMLMANQFPNTGTGGVGQTSAPRNYYDRARGVQALSDQALFAPADRVLTSRTGGLQVHGMVATPSLFRMLGVPAAAGRTFSADEGEVGNNARILLSDGLWRELYPGAPSVVGTALRVNGRPFTIVGVMPEGFSFFDSAVRFWIPLAFTPSERTNPIANDWYNIGRLTPGATREQAQAQVDAVNTAFLDELPKLRVAYQAMGYHTTVEPLTDVLVRPVRRVLSLLWAGALAVLFVGVINIANLTVAQQRLRTRDLATRLALGASRLRLGVGLIAEGVVIAMAGGGLGLWLGSLMLRSLARLQLDGVLPSRDLTMGAAVVALVVVLSLVAGTLIGLIPALQLRRLTLSRALRDHGGGGAGGARAGLLRRTLVIVQVALTFLVVIGAGAFLGTMRNLLAVNPGFAIDHLVTAAITVPRERYPDLGAVRALFDRLGPALRAVPGVQTAAAATALPLRTPGSAQAVIVEDHPMTSDESIVTPTWIGVTPGYFAAIDAPLRSGRDFDSRDGERGAVIVDETLARRFWPTGDPIGKRLFLPGIRNVLAVRDQTRWLTVVGVAADLRLDRLTGRTGAAGTFYTPYWEANANNPPRSFGFVIKAHGDPAAMMPDVRRALTAIDPELALFDVQTMAQRVTGSLARERLATSLASVFGCNAVLLSALGIYGLLAYIVAHRTRELGIRLALGSTGRAVFRLVLGEGLVVVGLGLLIGGAVAVALRPMFVSQMYGVSLDDPWLIGSVMVLLAAVALLACLAPARRATRLDPLIILNDTSEY